MKKVLFFLCGLISLTSGQDITSKQAWEYVLEHNDGIKAEELGLRRQEKLTLASKLSFLPEINITALYMHLANPIHLDISPTKKSIANTINNRIPQAAPVINSTLSQIPNFINLTNENIAIGSLNIIYPLYTGGRRMSGIKIAKLQEKDSIEALRLKKLATFEELNKIYYGVLLQREILQTLQDIQKGAEIHYQNAKKLYKAGQIAKIEVLGAQVALDKAKNKVKEASNTLEVSKMALDIALDLKGANPTSTIKVEKIQMSEESLVQRTLDSYPILKSLDHKVGVAKEMRHMEISRFLPEVSVMGSYFLDNRFLLGNQSLPSWYVGVFGKLPIITPGGRIPHVQAAKIAEMQLDKTKSQAIKDMEVLARKTYKEVTFAQQEYWSLDSSIKLAEENLKLQEEAFIQGLATSVQVTDARNLLASTLVEQKTIAYKYIVLLSKMMALSDDIALFYKIQY